MSESATAKIIRLQEQMKKVDEKVDELKESINKVLTKVDNLNSLHDEVNLLKLKLQKQEEELKSLEKKNKLPKMVISYIKCCSWRFIFMASATSIK